MFHKSGRGEHTVTPIAGDENWEAQLVASMQRISEGIADIQQTLGLLLTVLTMEEPAAADHAKQGEQTNAHT